MTLEEAALEVQEHMDGILACFKPGRKITVLVRTIGNDAADFCMTNDDLPEVAKMVERRARAALSSREREGVQQIDPAVLAAHAQFGGDLEDMQRRFEEGQK